VFVYKVTNQVNSKVYIGKTVKTPQARWRDHLRDAFHGSTILFHKVIRKYGPDAFELSEVCLADDRSQLSRLEKSAIQQYQSDKREHGYNLTPGGDDGGHSQTLEVRVKIGNALRGRKLSDEHKDKIRKARTGIKRPDVSALMSRIQLGKRLSSKTRTKMSLSRLGKVCSDETKKKISMAKMGAVFSERHRRNISLAKLGTHPRRNDKCLI
jgi:group I intron endonuclease